MKKFVAINLLILCALISSAQNNRQKLDFELDLDQLSDIRIKSDIQSFQIHPGLELTLEELDQIQIQKVVKVSSVIGIEYDLTLDELSELSISSNNLSIKPDFNTSLNTLSKLSLKEEYIVTDQINVPFGVSLETLAKLSLID